MAYGWSGDMDLIGIGVRDPQSVASCLPKELLLIHTEVFTSYYVEAILVTILLLTYSYWRLRKPFPSYRNPASEENKPGVADRFIVGLQESSQDFLEASELFSIAMLVAALYISGTGITNRQEGSDIPRKTAMYDVSSFRIHFKFPQDDTSGS